MGRQSVTDHFFKIPPVCRRHDLKTQFLIWHLVRGGLDNPEILSELTGKRITEKVVEGIVDTIDRLVFGPISPKDMVRCKECGSYIIDIPCRNCGLRKENYARHTR